MISRNNYLALVALISGCGALTLNAAEAESHRHHHHGHRHGHHHDRDRKPQEPQPTVKKNAAWGLVLGASAGTAYRFLSQGRKGDAAKGLGAAAVIVAVPAFFGYNPEMKGFRAVQHNGAYLAGAGVGFAAALNALKS